MTEKTIKIGGKIVNMLYCAATENGYEDISGKGIGVFVPTFGKDDEGKPIIIKEAEATIGDYVMLAYAGIIASATRRQEEVPITVEDILYEITPAERNMLVTTIAELRNEWYGVPKVAASLIESEDSDKEEGGEKN